jgi:5-deoxy-glucuronate isomerase
MQLLIRGDHRQYGEIVSVAPNGTDWHHVSFRVLRLPAGATFANDTSETEAVLVLIGGTADVRSSHGNYDRVGKRSSPFDGPPQAVYLPPDTTYDVVAHTDTEVAICAAAGSNAKFPARLLELSEGDGHQRGAGSAQRLIYDILMNPSSAASIFVTEVLTPPGNWSSYPPHKHDQDDPPRESALEEIYYYRAMPESGFAFQRVYTADSELDETMTVHDGDTVLVPRGYHVCAAAPEYHIYYLNVLAGPKHVYHMTFDPKHEWIKRGWTW